MFQGQTEGLARDDILDNIHHLTNTALSGARLYWEYFGKGHFNAKGVKIPVAVSVFPDVELGALMTDLEAAPSVELVVFELATPDFFIASRRSPTRPSVPRCWAWRDFVLRLSSTPVVSIAQIRGRTRGIGNQFVPACDMRFAVRQRALFSGSA